MTTTLKAIHYCATRISDLGEFLFNVGGAIECWADERVYKREQAARVERWAKWVNANEMQTIHLHLHPITKLDQLTPSDLAMPSPANPYPTTPLQAPFSATQPTTPNQWATILTEEEYYEAKREYEEWLAEQHQKGDE